MAAQLARTSFGRVLLHLACASRDHKYAWHWRGIIRELAKFWIANPSRAAI
jgi:hypothetical protein